MRRKIYFGGVVILITMGSLFCSVNCNGQGRQGPFKKLRERLARRQNKTPGQSKTPAGPRPNYTKVSIIGETAKMGIFDCSIEYDKDGNTGWLAYTALAPPHMHTRLAKTTDHGKTWKYVAEINSGVNSKVVKDGTTFEGQWRNEVPSIVHDPDDPGKEWKLFSHKYFIKTGGKYKTVSEKYRMSKIWESMYIAYKYADSPEKLASAEEIVLFATRPSPQLPHKARYYLNELYPHFSKTLAYTEPGSLYKDGVLYLSLSAGGGGDHKTCLFMSSDHGKTWKFSNVLTDAKDARRLGYAILTSSSLAEEKGRVFLLINPVILEGKEGVHHGTYIFEFEEDISKAKLKRDQEGNLIVHKYLRPSIETKTAGESDYDQNNINGGIIMPQVDHSGLKRGMDPQTVEMFKIYNTMQKIVD